MTETRMMLKNGNIIDVFTNRQGIVITKNNGDYNAQRISITRAEYNAIKKVLK